MRITVFTPTYNRAYTLTRLFESLKKQTFKDFEWLVVDDGSTDDTESLIRDFSTSGSGIPIIYKKTENGGKHRAINRGIGMASGELTLLMDSDDWLREDALEWIDRVERSIPDDQKQHFAGVQGLCVHEDGTVVGKTFPGSGYVDATTLERNRYNISGDKAEVYYTAVLRSYPFPEIGGEKFLTEGIVWNQIAGDGFKVRYFNEGIYYCEYLADGLTYGGNMLYAKNPKQWGLFIHSNYQYKAQNLFYTMLKVYTYFLFERSTGMSVSEMAGNLDFSILFVFFSVSVQAFADFLRTVIHRGNTVKKSVDEEKAAAVGRNIPGGGIPKIIHYCWFGRGEKPKRAMQCIESWKKILPDYTIKEWNEDNFDITCCTYVAEAYKAQKYAFVSDYARLFALYEEGGFYLDTDVEVTRSLNPLLNAHGVGGFEERGFIMTALIGAEKGLPIIGEWLQSYNGRHFVQADGTMDIETNVHCFTDLLVKHGLERNGCWQKVADIELFPTEYFSPKNYYTERIKLTPSTYTIHHFERSWGRNETVKQRILRKHRSINWLYYLPNRIGMKLLGSRYQNLKRWLKQ